MESINPVSVAYITVWALSTLVTFIKTLLFHIKRFRIKNRLYKIHIEEHLHIMMFMFVAQVLLFIYFAIHGNAIHEQLNIGHIGLGVLTVGNIYLFRHTRDEITCKEG